MSETTIAAIPIAKLDTFTRGYIECALWSSTDDQGQPLDQSEAELAPETIAKMAADCTAFQRDCTALLQEAQIESGRAGFLFWLNRNGHGSGFWDEGNTPVFRKLSDASRVWGSVDLYVGDDGLIYAM